MQESDKTGEGADLPEDGAQQGGTPEDGTERRAEPRPPAGSQAEQDAIFKELVASFDAPVDLRTWPDSEDLGEPPGRPRGNGPGDVGDLNRLDDFTPQPRPRPGNVHPASGPRDWDSPENPDDDHFVPPEPPPLPRTDTTGTFAWIAVIGGPVLLFFSALAWREISGWPAVLGVTAFIGGFVTLVARMKNRDEDDDDPHGGAVV
ncbi:hypothetical protein [Peterkaempfera sp. SMS 1(5)a]|uniref:hypothetical protein n=1 Tax=Peterkaempfera podocarpi TaxID=3232308 RepID=UPI00366C4925